MSRCDHTLHAIDADGRTTGSWVIRETEQIRRVECIVCGKFYGRLGDAKAHKNSPSPNQPHLERQQRRRETTDTEASPTKQPGARPMTKKPVHEVRFGLIKAAVWRNQTKAGDRYSVTFTRLFRNGDRWSESSSYGRDDLPLVAKAADLAHTWIFEQGGSDGGR